MLNKKDLLKLMGVSGEEPTPEQEAKAEYTLALSNLRAALLEARRLPGTETAVKTADEAIVAAEKLVAGAKKADFDAGKDALAASTEAMPKAIEQGRALLEKQNQQEEARHLKERKELRAREPYQAELVVANRALLSLRQQPGTEKQAADLARLIENAQVQAKAGKFEDAHKLLKGSEKLMGLVGDKGAGDLAKEGQEASKQCVSVAKDRFAARFEQHAKLGQRLTGSGSLHPDVRAGFATELADALTPLYAKSAGKQADALVNGELLALAKRIETAISTADAQRKTAQQGVANCKQALGSLTQDATPSDRADLDDRFLRLNGLLEQCEYESAIDGGLGFVEDCIALSERVGEAKGAWQQQGGRLKTLAGACQRWIDSPLPVLSKAQPSPSALMARIEQLAKAEVGTQTSYAQAQLLLDSIVADHDALAQRVEANQVMVKAAQAGGLRVQAALEKARHEMAALLKRSDSAIRKETGNPLSTAGDYGPKVQAQAERWERNQKSATIESDLEVEPIEAELNRLADAMAKITGSSDYFGLLGVEQQAKAAKEYAKERETVATLLGQLMPWGSSRQDSLQAALEDLDRKVEAARAEEEIRQLLMPRLMQLRDEVRLALSEAFGRHEELRQQCRKADTAIAKELDAFEQTLATYDQSFLTKSPEYRAYFKTLVDQHKPLQGMMDERDLDLLAGTAADLNTLLARVQVGHAALKGRSLPPGAPTLDAVDSKVSKGRDALGTEVLSEYLPSTHRTLKSQLDDIAKNKLKRPIDTSLDALARWQQQLNAGLVKASQAEQDYEKFKAELKGVQKKLDDGEPQFADQPQYLEALQARLDACLTAGKAEGQLAGEQDALKQIEADLALALSNPEAMKAGQQQASAVAELKKQDKATWKGLYQAFSDTTLPQVRKLADGALVKEIVQLGQAAQQTFSKTADLAVARQQLQLATDRAQDAIAYPGGKALHFRKALGPAQERWKSAVDAFHRQLDDLAGKVGAAEATHEASVKESAQGLKDLLQAGAFQRCVESMNRPAAGPAELRAAREEGLATLRRYRQAVQTQRQMVALSTNPFVRFQALMELNNALFDLERNLLISA